MAKKPTVSVIIPTYNRAHLIVRAIQSVLNQTYQDFELIIVDDGSTDNTEEVIRKFQEQDKRVKYIRHEKNRGGSAARNTGIKNAKGEYIAFQDSDDEWLPEKLKKQMEVFKDAPSELGVVSTGYIFIDELNGDTGKQFIPKKKGWIYEELLAGNCVGTTSTILIKRKCFEKAGLFDENLPSCQDWEMWIRIAKGHQFDFIENPLVRYYIHKNRITTDLENKIKGIKIVINKYFEEFISRRKAYSRLRFILGNLYCRIENMEKGRKEFLKAIKLFPFYVKYYIYFGSALLGADIYMKIAHIKNIAIQLKNKIRIF